MEKIKNLVVKLKSKEFLDPKNLGLILLGVAALSVTWSSAKAIQQNHNLLKKVAQIQEQNKLLELQNSTKKLRNQYYTTNQYAEVSARRLLGVAGKDERLYIVPKDVAKAMVSEPFSDNKSNDEATDNPVQKPRYQQNFEAWMELFFGQGLSD